MRAGDLRANEILTLLIWTGAFVTSAEREDVAPAIIPAFKEALWNLGRKRLLAHRGKSGTLKQA